MANSKTDLKNFVLASCCSISPEKMDDIFAEECPTILKAIQEDFNTSYTPNHEEYFWFGVIKLQGMLHTFEEEGRKGLRESEKHFVEAKNAREKTRC